MVMVSTAEGHCQNLKGLLGWLQLGCSKCHFQKQLEQISIIHFWSGWVESRWIGYLPILKLSDGVHWYEKPQLGKHPQLGVERATGLQGKAYLFINHMCSIWFLHQNENLNHAKPSLMRQPLVMNCMLCHIPAATNGTDKDAGLWKVVE